MMEEKEFTQVEETVTESPALEAIEELQEETQQEEVEQGQKQPQRSTTEQDNIVRLRKAREAAERERDEAIAYIRQMQQKQAQPVEPEEDLSINLAPDDLVDGKTALKLSRKMQKVEKEQRERLEQYEQRLAALTAEAQLRTKYPDIDNVINADNLQILKDEEPELFSVVMRETDIYSKSVAAYKMIKKLALEKDPVVQENKARVQQNLSKPRRAASVAPQRSESPLDKANAYANGLTKEMKEQARREMAAILGR
jgi:hypothetical protein